MIAEQRIEILERFRRLTESDVEVGGTLPCANVLRLLIESVKVRVQSCFRLALLKGFISFFVKLGEIGHPVLECKRRRMRAATEEWRKCRSG
jgi:hypothetical protein